MNDDKDDEPGSTAEEDGITLSFERMRWKEQTPGTSTQIMSFQLV